MHQTWRRCIPVDEENDIAFFVGNDQIKIRPLDETKLPIEWINDLNASNCGEYVRKRIRVAKLGRSTGFTTGFISCFGAYKGKWDIYGSNIPRLHVETDHPNLDPKVFAAEGDSGSLVFRYKTSLKKLIPIGIIKGGIAHPVWDGLAVTFVTPLTPEILSKFQSKSLSVEASQMS